MTNPLSPISGFLAEYDCSGKKPLNEALKTRRTWTEYSRRACFEGRISKYFSLPILCTLLFISLPTEFENAFYL